MDSIIKIIEQYNGKQRVPSTLDCLTMLLEVLGRADLLELIRGRYKTIRGGLVRLPKLTGLPSLDMLMLDTHEVIDPRFIQDFDVMIQNGSHVCLYFQCCLFGVNATGIFEMQQVNLPLEVPNAIFYRKMK